MDIDDIRDRWNREASQFDAIYGSSSGFMRGANRVLRKAVLQRFDFTIREMIPKPGASVLDVGCGSGVYEEALLDAGASSVVGVDVSEGMLDMARTRMNAHKLGSAASFALANFQEWETEERFDYVVAMGVFDYAASPAELIGKMRQLSRRRLVVSLPTHSRFRIRSTLRKLRYRLTGKGDVYYYTKKEVERLAGLCNPCQFTLRDLGGGQGYFLIVDCLE